MSNSSPSSKKQKIEHKNNKNNKDNKDNKDMTKQVFALPPALRHHIREANILDTDSNAVEELWSWE